MENVIYPVLIRQVNFKFSQNHSPYIEIVGETLDDNKLLVKSCYFFTTKSKYFSHKEIEELFNSLNITMDNNNLFNSFKELLNKKVYLQPIKDFDSKYTIIPDYKEIQ